MSVMLTRLQFSDAPELLALQQQGFQDIYEKYHDEDTNPVNESLEHLLRKLEQPFSFFYRITVDGVTVGAIRVVYKQDGSMKRISPLFILPEFRGRGYAQAAIRAAEAAHGSTGWSLGTIAQEPRNCHLYEKMGYRATGETKQLTEHMFLIFYEK